MHFPGGEDKNLFVNGFEDSKDEKMARQQKDEVP